MTRCVIPKPDLQRESAAEPRSIYYGWVMLPMSIAAMIASSPGQTFGVSVFNEPMRLSLGLSHSQLAAAYMLGTLLGAVPITFIGHQMDRHGLRRTMLAVVTLFCAACIFTSFVQGWLALVAAFCLLRMLGPGALSFLSGNTLSFWFERRLGLVEGIRQLGMAAAMGVIPALNLWLVAQWGWRGAYGVFGTCIWVVLFPAVMFLFRDHPAEMGQQIDGRPLSSAELQNNQAAAESYWGLTLNQSLRNASFWIVTAGTALFGLIHTAVFFCLVPILQERGLSAGDAAITLTTFAGFLAVMQLPAGILADRIEARLLLLTGMGGLAAANVLLLFSDTLLLALASGALLGASQAIYFGGAHPLWARYFGRRHLGKIRGVLMTINVGSSSLGPLFAGLTRDWYGNFNVALFAFAAAPLPIAVLSLLVAAAPRETFASTLSPVRAARAIAPR